jgi:hypothetical protein
MGRECRMNRYEQFIYNLLAKPEGKRPLTSQRYRWLDNTKIDLRDIKLEVNWIHLAQDKDQWQALANMVMQCSGSIKCREFLD